MIGGVHVPWGQVGWDAQAGLFWGCIDFPHTVFLFALSRIVPRAGRVPNIVARPLVPVGGSCPVRRRLVGDSHARYLRDTARPRRPSPHLYRSPAAPRATRTPIESPAHALSQTHRYQPSTRAIRGRAGVQSSYARPTRRSPRAQHRTRADGDTLGACGATHADTPNHNRLSHIAQPGRHACRPVPTPTRTIERA